MEKLLIIVGLVISLQLAENQYEVVALSHPLSVQKQSLGPIGGISVDHPLQATVYAYRRGKMKLLVPFEIMIVPMGSGTLEPERPSNGIPISGQIGPQQGVNGVVYNQNPTYQQYPAIQYAPNYYPPTSTYQPTYSYAPNNGYYNYNQQQTSSYRNPYYPSPVRRVDISQTRPWPQYHRLSQQGNTKPINATQNWPGNNSPINISSLVNNTHPSNVSLAPLNATTTTTTTTSTTTSTTTTTTTAQPPTNVLPIPEQNSKTSENVGPPNGIVKSDDMEHTHDMEAASNYDQPIFVQPPSNFMTDSLYLPNGMQIDGEYNNQMSGGN